MLIRGEEIKKTAASVSVFSNKFWAEKDPMIGHGTSAFRREEAVAANTNFLEARLLIIL